MKHKSLILFTCSSLFVLFLFVVQSEAKKITVIFDQGHGQKFLIEKEGELQLSKFSGLLKGKGYDVSINVKEIDDAVLKTADALIVSGAFKPFSPEETNAVIRFVERGGKLCVMLHVPQPLTGLMSRLKVYASNGVIQERENTIDNSPLNFYVTNMKRHKITKRLKKFAAYGVWALMTESPTAKIIALTGPKAWIDLNGNSQLDEADAQQAFGVIVEGSLGKGRYVIFGDDAIFQNKFLDQDNLLLGKNLADWMK